MLNEFVKKIISKLDFSRYRSVMAGFSGGADSTLLLLVMHEISRMHNFQLNAVHFEHGIRGDESKADALWCEEFCRKAGIPFKRYELNVPTFKLPGEGIEEAARRMRAEIYEKIASDSETCVVLGHHSGDKIENLFIRLMRGANSSGLTSLRDTSIINGVTYIRPLLDFEKKEIEDALKSFGINDWRIDSTNSNSDYRRNFIRNELLPLLLSHDSKANAAVRASYSALEIDARYLDQTASAEYMKISGSDCLDLDYMRNLHPALRVRIIRYFISAKLQTEFIPSKNFIERFNYETQREHSEKTLLPLNSSSFLVFHKSKICLSFAEEKSQAVEILWEWRKESKIQLSRYFLKSQIITYPSPEINFSNRNSVWFDTDKLPDKFIIKTWSKGERFLPYNSSKPVKISKILQNEKVYKRDNILIIKDINDNSYWIIGVKRSDAARITETTKRVLCISMEQS